MHSCIRHSYGFVQDVKGREQPRWEIFSVLNSLSLVVFGASALYMLRMWISDRGEGVMHFFADPAWLLAFVAGMASLFYMMAFFGVALVHEDIGNSKPVAVGPAPSVPSATAAGYDADVSAC